MMFRDLMLGTWIVTIAALVYVAIPTIALGRPRARATWAGDTVAASVWAGLTTITIVPPLARFHLLNWMTAMLVPLAWPVALWLYRYRGAPRGEFRRVCRAFSLWLMSVESPHVRVPFGWSLPGALLGGAIVGATFWPALHELRLASAADYETLAATRRLLGAGEWVSAPAASIAAILTRLSVADPMQVLRFLRPLVLLACAMCLGVFIRRVGRSPRAALVPPLAVAIGSLLPLPVPTASLDALMTGLFVVTLLPLLAFAAERVHRRDRWHVAAAAAVVVSAALQPAHAAAAGPVEYDAAARVALAVAARFDDGAWVIVAPPEQRVEVPRAEWHYDLAAFVRRYDGRTGARTFRFDLPARDLFVFVEKAPLPMTISAAMTRARTTGAARAYVLSNARARIERQALALCNAYRQTHAGATIFYEDAELRVYHFVR